MRRPRGRIQYSWQRRSFGVAPDRKSVFWTVDAVTGPGWHRGRQGTEWYRVPLESEQKRAPYPWVFQAVSSAVLVLIDGPDFDCVSVTVWPARCGSLPLGVIGSGALPLAQDRRQPLSPDAEGMVKAPPETEWRSDPPKKE